MEISLEERLSKIQQAVSNYYETIRDEITPQDFGYCYIIYDTYLIVRTMKDEYYQVMYTITDNEVVLDTRDLWTQVERAWVETANATKALQICDMPDTFLITCSNEPLKTYIKDNHGYVKALGLRFGTPNERDLQGDYFTSDTDYGPNLGNGVAATLNHRIPLVTTKSTTSERQFLQTLAKHPFKYPVKAVKTDMGILVEHVLDLADEYEQLVFDLAQKGKFRWSSGSAPHMVDRDSTGQVKTWHIVEWAYTPYAAEPRLPTISPVKSLDNVIVNLDVTNSQKTKGKTKMNDNRFETTEEFQNQMKSILNGWKTEAVDAPISDLKNDVKSINTALENVLNLLENKSIANPGYFTETGGKSDRNIKSFGDFLLSVRRGDTVRLSKVYSTTKAMGEDSGAAGGWLVPTDYSTQLLQITPQTSPVLSRVNVIPVNTASGDYPTIDQYFTPAAGQNPAAGGVKGTQHPENVSASSTDPTFDMLHWRVHKTDGYTQVSNELIADSPNAIEALLRSLFQIAIAAKQEYQVLRGTGVGEPLGILNSSAIYNVTPATNNLFSWTDVGSMQARFKQIGNQPPVWLIHPSIWPDILTMEVGTAGGAVWAANMQGGMGNTINGYQIVQSSHLPSANSAGAVILADLYGYLLFRREELAISFSEHIGFLEGKGTWRFESRIDGMPWLRQPIVTDPSGYSVSNFVVHND